MFKTANNCPDCQEYLAGVHIPDEALWYDVKTGKLNGFSLEGMSMKESKIAEMSIADKMIVLPQHHFI
ncbi:MAG: hypothetical protein JKY41_06680 [Rhodobacteraceae bacterium]|nr:hypothetical protein [Paracoccaceae bacterium]